MTQVPDEPPRTSDVALQAPPAWRDPDARSKFGVDSGPLKVPGQEYGDAWPGVVAQARAGTTRLPSGASTVLPAAQGFKTLRSLQEQGGRTVRCLGDTSLNQERFALLCGEVKGVAGTLHLATAHLAGSLQERRPSFLGLHFGQIDFEGAAQGVHLQLGAQAFSRSAEALCGRVDGLVRKQVARVRLAV